MILTRFVLDQNWYWSHNNGPLWVVKLKSNVEVGINDKDIGDANVNFQHILLLFLLPVTESDQVRGKYIRSEITIKNKDIFIW